MSSLVSFSMFQWWFVPRPGIPTSGWKQSYSLHWQTALRIILDLLVLLPKKVSPYLLSIDMLELTKPNKSNQKKQWVNWALGFPFPSPLHQEVFHFNGPDLWSSRRLLLILWILLPSTFAEAGCFDDGFYNQQYLFPKFNIYFAPEKLHFGPQ